MEEAAPRAWAAVAAQAEALQAWRRPAAGREAAALRAFARGGGSAGLGGAAGGGGGGAAASDGGGSFGRGASRC